MHHRTFLSSFPACPRSYLISAPPVPSLCAPHSQHYSPQHTLNPPFLASCDQLCDVVLYMQGGVRNTHTQCLVVLFELLMYPCYFDHTALTHNHPDPFTSFVAAEYKTRWTRLARPPISTLSPASPSSSPPVAGCFSHSPPLLTPTHSSIVALGIASLERLLLLIDLEWAGACEEEDEQEKGKRGRGRGRANGEGTREGEEKMKI